MPGFNHWAQIAAAVKPGVKAGILRACKETAQTASANAPYETGFMAGNVYYSTPGESSYGAGPGPTKTSSYLLEEVRPPDEMSGVVGAAANYSVFVEMGHHVHNSSAYVPAHPWFFPSVELSAPFVGEAIAEELAKAFEAAAI